MIVWRISEFVSLNGQGGMLVPGRWHAGGLPIVYSANSRALAMLETIVHLERTPPPDDFQLLGIDIPDHLAITNWSTDPSRDHWSTVGWGQRWLTMAETPIACVPSVISPGDTNWLINPLHPEATSVRIVETIRHPWDKRLLN